uniref:Peptidase S1 domain-containing protein n=1 Tax=Varanus komodoensis TaxID=61221 RepID=A0A8D2LV01_VARKO
TPGITPGFVTIALIKPGGGGAGASVCGNRPLALGHGTQLRIVGGSDALPGTWPWVVSFQFPTRTGWRHFCAGSLINSRWVLTTPGRPRPRGKRGAPGITCCHTECATRCIKRLVDHEKFRPTAHVYDISLIELSEPVECNDYIQPACLPDTHLRRDLLTKCFICGWGHVPLPPAERANTSDVLQEAEVELVDPYVCNMSWYFTAIRNEHICAMPIEARIDGCRGDGGGPLMCRAENSPRFWVVGINGWGRGCSVQRRPGVFTSTQTFIPWIQKTLNWPPESALVPPYKPTPPPPPPTPSTTRIYPVFQMIHGKLVWFYPTSQYTGPPDKVVIIPFVNTPRKYKVGNPFGPTTTTTTEWKPPPGRLTLPARTTEPDKWAWFYTKKGMSIRTPRFRPTSSTVWVRPAWLPKPYTGPNYWTRRP